MNGGTLFSGIGTPELAAPWVDWRWCAEIDPFASAVHAARFPNIRNLGDVRKFPNAIEPVELLVFGSPCQSFSVAGKRAGLDDPRGNMALIGLQIVDRVRPDWVVFENVPGLLSSDEWRDFGTFLEALGECGYGFAYRILDAQYAGVPQRRRRVFVVGYLGDWRPPAAVLFERESLSWNSAPSREAREGITGSLSSRATAGGGLGTDFECGGGLVSDTVRSHPRPGSNSLGLLTHFNNQGHGWWDDAPVSQAIRKGDLNGSGGARESTLFAYGGSNTSGSVDLATACNAKGRSGRMDFDTETFVTHSLRADGFDAGEDGTGRGTPIIPIPSAFRTSPNCGGWETGARTDALTSGTDRTSTVLAFTERTRSDGRNLETQEDIAYALCNPGSGGRTHSRQLLDSHMAVRRLTPLECERLQGFPDFFTLIKFNGKPAADGPRYRALGNAMAVPVIGWVLNRIREFKITATP